jgi:hypothetical protein
LKRFIVTVATFYLIGCASPLLPNVPQEGTTRASSTMTSNKERSAGQPPPKLTLRQVKNSLLTKFGLVVVEIEPLVIAPAVIGFRMQGEEGICHVTDGNCSLDLRALLKGKKLAQPASLEVLFFLPTADSPVLSITADMRKFVSSYFVVLADQTALFSRPSLSSVLPERATKGDILEGYGASEHRSFLQVSLNGRQLWVPRSSGQIYYQMD